MEKCALVFFARITPIYAYITTTSKEKYYVTKRCAQNWRAKESIQKKKEGKKKKNCFPCNQVENIDSLSCN
jgi:hypothetical protein